MVKRMLPNRWWSCGLWIMATYVIAADLLPNSLLVLVNSAGYLPYSDRPGPGWQMPHLPTGEELQFFVGFASLLLGGDSLLRVNLCSGGIGSRILFAASLGTPSPGCTGCVSRKRIDDGCGGVDDRNIFDGRLHRGRMRSALGIVRIS
jgi:hypothetical protein